MAKAPVLKRGTGKRKEAIARVVLKPGKGDFTINGKTLFDYFGNLPGVVNKVNKPFEITGLLAKFDAEIIVSGGGKIGQSDAIMYGIAKALTVVDPENRKALKAAGLMARDARIKERKKYGQPGARKKYQFSKR